MVLISNSNENKTINTHRYSKNIGNYKTGKDFITDQSSDVTNEIILESKSILILELK